MKIHHYFFCLLFCYCCTNCTNSNQSNIDSDFPISSNLTPKDSINLEEKGLLLPFSVTSFDSCFIFSNIRVENRLSIIDKQNNKLINTAYIGDGPNEIIQYLPVSNNDNKFLFADRVRGKIFELELKNDYTYKQIIQINDSINRFYSLAMLDSTSIIGTGMFDKGRFLIYNITNDTYKYEEKYPNNRDTHSLLPYQKAALFAGTLIGVHPDKNKFVAAYKGLIDFYTINKNQKLSPIMHKNYHFPLFSIPEKGPVIAHKKEGITGFLSLSYNSSYIYLLYSNTSLLEKGSSTFSSNIILVYNWDGIPIKRYILSNNVLSIYIENNTIWGIGENHKYLYKYEF